MARGHQKIQSQQKNAKKQAELKKAKGHDQKTAAKAALVFTCLVCKLNSGWMNTIQEQSRRWSRTDPLRCGVLGNISCC
uniref:Small EDRK-rich factor-like N-terminal domain-containing protein n=1 Tax=Mola mola TaxID=94237 RepID=A0A3Q4BR76_MOLML